MLLKTDLKLRVAFIGNMANNHYREVKALREGRIIDADLFMVNDKKDLTRLPESDEPSLKNNYPEWIKIYEGVKTSKLSILLLLFGITGLLKKQNDAILKKLNKYNICIMSGDDVRLAPLIKPITIFRATGGDLTVYPIFNFKEMAELNPSYANSNYLSYIRNRFQWFLDKMSYRIAIKSCDYIDEGFGSPYKLALKKLNVSKRKIIHFFRLAIDTSIFLKRSDTMSIRERFALKKFNFIIFLPSRMMIKNSDVLKDTGQWKASDNALKGFKYFLDKTSDEERKSIGLLIPERNFTPDLRWAKDFVKENDLLDNVRFIRGNYDHGLSRSEMIDIFSISDLVMDDFGAGWYGSIVVEALSCGVPVVSYVPEELLNKMFPWHPIQIAKEPSEICHQLLKCFRDPRFLKSVGIKSRQWAIEFHSNETIKKRLELKLSNFYRSFLNE